MTAVFDLLNSPIQRGATLIEASAGTGKTYTITGLVLRLLLEKTVSGIANVLVVTFTKAATQELHERIRSALCKALRVFSGLERDQDMELLYRRHGEPGRKLLQEALLRFDEVTISTIHGFCKRMLEQNAFESGVPFDVELIQDDYEMRLTAARDFWRRSVTSGDKMLANLVVSNGWTPDTFLVDFDKWRRHPHTEVLPESLDLASLAGRLQGMIAVLSAAWDRQSLAFALDRVVFNKDTAPFGQGRLDAFLDRLEAFVLDGDFHCLDALLKLDFDQLSQGINKRKKNRTAMFLVLEHPFIEACRPLREFVDGVKQSLRLAFIRGVHENYRKRRIDENILTYDDLLERLHEAICDPRGGPRIREAIRKQYGIALIDEFQDTDQVQYEIFRRTFSTMFLIGDPKQAIYSFRGADIFAYLVAKGDAHRHYTLDRNWRSHRLLVKAVNSLFAKARKPFVFADIPFHEVRPAGRADCDGLSGDDEKPLSWWFVPPVLNEKHMLCPLQTDKAEILICNAVANTCNLLLERSVRSGERKLHPGDFAVLVRSNRQAELVRDTLVRAGLPCVIAQSGDIFATAEMAELQMILEAIIDPLQRTRLHAALATEIWGRNARFIAELETDEAAWLTIVENCAEYRRRWLTLGFMPMIQKVFADLQVRRRLRAYSNGERRLTNLLHAAEVLHQKSAEHDTSPETLARWLASERAREQHDKDSTELRLDSDDRAVQIVTVHKSKGLEYNVVFCPFLWQSIPVRGPDPVLAHTEDGSIVYDCGSPLYERHRAQAEDERIAEDLRLVYVALTRACQRCYVVWGPISRASTKGGIKGGPFASALGYLIHQPGNDLGSQWTKQVTDHLSSRWLEWQDELKVFTAAHADCMSMTVLPEQISLERRLPFEETPGNLEARQFPVVEARFQSWRLASFSSLTSGKEGERPDREDPADPTAEVEVAVPQGIFAFAKGAHPGICLHEILEHLSFQELDSAPSQVLIRETLARYDLLEPIRHPHPLDPEAAVKQMLRSVLETAIPTTGMNLASLTPQSQLNEWHFYMPMGSVRPRQLARLFANHASDRIRADYVPLLEKLEAGQLSGFLTGYVDLCFEHKERWSVVDWKSNYLGPQAESYDDVSMWEAMCGHHYVLQYHIYVTALHRFLRARLRNYRYDTHMGPVAYVFLRGVDGSERYGWYTDQPPESLINELDAFFSGKEVS